jgi:hypothetical protein
LKHECRVLRHPCPGARKARGPPACCEGERDSEGGKEGDDGDGDGDGDGARFEGGGAGGSL